MIRSALMLFLFSTLILACNQTASQQQNTSDSTTDTEDTKFKSFGEKITEEGAITYDVLLDKMKQSESVEATVTGTVTSVCQAKGCWMNITSDDPGKPEMFVKFKDYGFFMPLDIAGQKVIMRGNAFREVTSVDELRHYAEDEGKSKEDIAAITEPIEELKFMADGVLLIN